MRIKIDSPLLNILDRITDAVLVNVLFVFLCIPVVTFGSARTSLYETAFEWDAGERAGARQYLKRFRKNLRSESAFGVLMIGIAVILGADLRICFQKRVPVMLLGAIIVLCFLYLAYREQLFLVRARFVSTRKESLRNAAALTVGTLLRAMVSGILMGLPLLVLMIRVELFINLIPVWLLIYYAGMARLVTIVMKKPYSRLVSRFSPDTDSGKGETENE